MGLIFACLIRRADRHQDFSIGTEFPHSLGIRVDHPQIARIIEADRVRVLEHSFSPGFHELPLGRVHLDRNLAAVERPHISIRRNSNARHRRPFATGGLFQRPGRIDFVCDRIIDSWVRHSMLRLRKRAKRCHQQTNKNQ